MCVCEELPTRTLESLEGETTMRRQDQGHVNILTRGFTLLPVSSNTVKHNLSQFGPLTIKQFVTRNTSCLFITWCVCVCACGLFNVASCLFFAQDRKIGDQKNAATRQRLWFSVFQNQACELFFRETISAMGISSCNLYNMTPAHTTCGHEPSWSSLSGVWDLEPSTCVKISHADQVKVLQTSALHVPLILHGHSWCRKDPTGLKPGSGKIVSWQAPQQLPHQSLCCPARTAKKTWMQ